MTSKTKDEIKAFFQTGDKPTEAQFIDFIDSYVDKSGPIGQLETAASGAAAGIATFNGATPNIGTITAYDVVRAAMGITVYTTALVTGVAGNTVVTTAQASAIASDTISAAYATTAQAQAGTAATGIMSPVLVKNAISALSGGEILISTKNANNSATIDFTNGVGSVVLDGSYSEYIVRGMVVVAQTNNTDLQFLASINGGSTYAVTLNQTGLNTATNSGSTSVFNETAGSSLRVCGTGAVGVGNASTQSCSFEIRIISPTSSRYKLVYGDSFFISSGDYGVQSRYGATCLTTSSINAIRFMFSSGNIVSGTFKLYGVP